MWKPTAEATGLPDGLRIHDLRHSAVALLISQGAYPAAIKRYMGHSSISVTMDVYGHLFPSDAEDQGTSSTSYLVDEKNTGKTTADIGSG